MQFLRSRLLNFILLQLIYEISACSGGVHQSTPSDDGEDDSGSGGGGDKEGDTNEPQKSTLSKGHHNVEESDDVDPTKAEAGPSEPTTMAGPSEPTTMDPHITQLLAIGGENKQNLAHDDVEIIRIPSSKEMRNCQPPPKYPLKVLSAAYTYMQRKALVCGGVNSNGGASGIEEITYSNCYAYDGPQRTWTPVASMFSTRSWFDGVWTPDWKWWVIGGSSQTSDVEEGIKTTEIYDPNDDKWEKGPDLLQGLVFHCVTYLEQKRNYVLAASSRPIHKGGTAWVFNWGTKKWTRAAEVPELVGGGCTVCGLTKGISGDVILLGKSGTFTIDAAKLVEDPDGTKWETIETGRDKIHGGTLFFDSGIQQLLLIGADDAKGQIVYKFDNKENKWHDTGIKMKTGRYHSAIIPLRQETLKCN